jgi:ATP-dependent DNA helicase RecQ
LQPNKSEKDMAVAATASLTSSLKEYFGFEKFKGQQESIIKSVLSGNDTLVIMPTGGGKSLCYQLPAVMSEGTAIIVSPLIALMKNQVDLVRSYSSNDDIAHFLNSSLNKGEIKQVKKDITDGKTKLLFVAPETLTKEENIDFLRDVKISFIAVDEAHCISEWGHDFRPEYRRIRAMMQLIGQDVAMVALTATATPKVQTDIIKNLGLREPKIFMSSFNRTNLYYEIRPKVKKEVVERQIIQYIKQHEGKSGIIYVLSRKSTEEIAQLLNVNGIKAAPYHAGLDQDVRAKTQDDFLQEQVQVIVATIAFGMGIDKPDIRFVLHYNIPKSLENYYQETGRAGRDGQEGNCILFYSHKDVHKLEKFMKDKPLSEREMAAQLIMEMVAYAETSACRRKFVLHYFGETYDDSKCNNMCDNCRNPKELAEGKEQVALVLKSIKETGETLMINNLVDFITGRKTQEIENYGYHKKDLFGKGSDQSELYWNSVIRHAMMNSFILKDIEQYGLLLLTEEGNKFIKKPTSVKFAINQDFTDAVGSGSDEEEAKPAVLDPKMLNLLKDLRKKIAKDQNIPTYVIFQENSLEEMATQYPITIDELCNISGVSKGKAERYGKPFLKLIEQYVEENDIDRPDDFVMKSVMNKSSNKVAIILSIDKRIPLEDIAKSRNIKMPELVDELESIVMSGTKVNIDYYLEDIMDEEIIEVVYDYFREAESDDLDTAFHELKSEGVSVEEIRLVRLKFLSEMAN